MKKKIKQFYEAPLALILEVAQEGAVCTSGVEPEFNPMDPEQNWIF